MENMLLVTLSRQMSLRRELDVIANNVANVNTNGFQRRIAQSREMQVPVASVDTFRPADRRVSFSVDHVTPLDSSLGTLEPTNNLMDIAVTRDAYFVVQTPQGERFTRNGAMMINPNGELVNSDGHRMLGEQGLFQISSQESDLRVATDGTVTTSSGSKGRLRLASFGNSDVLQNEGANLFRATAEAQPAPFARIQSGFVERSNVRPVVEISRMIEVNRQYQNIANMMSRQDELRRSAISKLAEFA
jgi:flagellar basal-body rod protein FlgF